MPAARATCAPFPGMISSAWICVPVGRSRNRAAFPVTMSTPLPETSLSPTERPAGAMT